MAIKDLREAVRSELQTDTGVEFVSGAVPEGAVPLMRRDRGYVWVEGFRRLEDTAIWETVEVHALRYVQYIEARSDEEPVDPEPLEDAAEALRDALQNRRALVDSAGGSWLLVFVGCELDYDTQSVEAVLTAGRPNPYET